MTVTLPSAADVASSLDIWCEQYPLLKSLIAEQNHPAAALQRMGRNQLQSGATDVAVRMFMAATALMPDNGPLWSDLATVLRIARRTDDAIECFKMSLQKDPAQPLAWTLLGQIYSGMSQYVEAEEAFLAALGFDSRLAGALRGLGLVYFRQRRIQLAADRLKAAIACGDSDPSLHGYLGLALSAMGEFEDAANVFAEQVRLKPEPHAAINCAQARMMAALIAGTSAEDALRIYLDTAGSHAERPLDAMAGAFQLLSAFGHHEIAIRVGRARLTSAPDDPVQQYLLSALERRAPSRAPDDYLRAHFDRFADRFDRQLVDVLDYHVPEKLAAILKSGFARVLDLGCGTGLAGPLLRSKSAHLTGVDISPRMLEKARQRGVYDALIESEIVAFLNANTDAFGLIFATDVLIYFGDLDPLMTAAARSLEAKGCFAFSIETTQSADYEVLPSGRFAQSLAYVEKVSQPHFRMLVSQPTTIRNEHHRAVGGALICLERV